jgi:Spy/CpxP family protein refolding chaperone
MKALKVLLPAALVVLAAGLALGQRGAGGERRGGAGGMMRGQPGGGSTEIINLLADLNLTDGQRDQVDRLRADFDKRMQQARDQMRTKMQEIRQFQQDNPNDQEGLRKLRDEMRRQMAPQADAFQGFIEDVKAVLNEEQLKKFNELLEQRRTQGPAGRLAQRIGAGFPPLPPAQIEQLGLTDEQKQKLQGIITAYDDEQRKLVEKYHGMLKEMLTPEQNARLEQMITEFRNRLQNVGMGLRRAGRQNRGGREGARMKGQEGRDPEQAPQ